MSCSGPVDVPVPTPTPAASAACAQLMAALPGRVDGQTRVDRTPESLLTAAWGDPAIVVRCGVATPEALQPTSQLVTVDGIDWLPENLASGYRFTTVGRLANVEVTVPDHYAPEADALVDLAATIHGHDARVIDAHGNDTG